MLENLSNIELYKKINEGYDGQMITDIIKNNTIKEMKKRLEINLGKSNSDKLIDCLKKENVIISGSFIIQCMLGEYWTQSDIDIFYITDEKDVDISFVNENDFLLVHYPSCIYERFLGDYLYRYAILKNKHTGELVQILNLSNNSMKSLDLNDIFDFDICKNYFHYKNGNEVLDIYDIDSIMNKKIASIQTEKFELFLIFTRLRKYKKRGFEFDENEYNKILEKCKKTYRDIDELKDYGPDDWVADRWKDEKM